MRPRSLYCGSLLVISTTPEPLKEPSSNRPSRLASWTIPPSHTTRERTPRASVSPAVKDADTDQAFRLPILEPVGERRAAQPKSARKESFIATQRRSQQAFHIGHRRFRDGEIESMRPRFKQDGKHSFRTALHCRRRPASAELSKHRRRSRCARSHIRTGWATPGTRVVVSRTSKLPVQTPGAIVSLVVSQSRRPFPALESVDQGNGSTAQAAAIHVPRSWRSRLRVVTL